MRYFVSFLIVFWTSLAPLLAQGAADQKFAMDVEKFPKQVESFLQNANKIESAFISKAFEKVWESGFYSIEEQRDIIKEANKLAEIRVRVFPDFSNYIEAVTLFSGTEMNKSIFYQWMEIVDSYTKNAKQKRDLTKVLDFLKVFFESKSLYKTASGSVNWEVTTYDFNFDNADGKFLMNFKATSLICKSKGNHIDLFNTSGTYDVLNSVWTGKNGKVTFEGAGNDPQYVWVDINDYQIDMTHAKYEADSVIYHNKKFLKEPLLGKLIDKVVAKQSATRVSYPRFQSKNVHIPIKDIVKGVDYLGGFAQQGAKIIGSGTDEEPATIIFYREEKPFMVASSKRFLMNINQLVDNSDDDDLGEASAEGQEVEEEEEDLIKVKKSSIVSSSCRVVIHLDGDSIMHPSLKFNFFTDEKVVNLIRVKGEMSETPYSNSFHKVEMRFDVLRWNIEHPIIEFTSQSLGTDKVATFESEGFYSKRQFESLQGASSWHPLSRLRTCAKKYDTNVVSLREATECMKIPVTGVEPMLLRYTVMGYVDYNQDLKEVTLNPKLFHQVNAYNDKEDYDVLFVRSRARGRGERNATLNLMNLDLTITGISSIVLSATHSVKILPDSGTIVMKRNRDFDFNGIIQSGKVDFYGNNFSFLYDDFMIDLPILDSMQIWASTKERDRDGYLLETRVRTVIEGLTGDLKIDHPENKSGKEKMPEYPIFNSKENSYAFYDKKSIFNGVYDRNDFYFELKPFEIDSLDKFTNEGIAFEGVFRSAGIMPDIEESLSLQEDYSLGFKRIAPPGGYPLYGGKGDFKNEVHLSNQGLKGNGTIEYLTSIAESEDFYFFPKEVKGVTKAVQIEEQMASVEYPNLAADTTQLRWVPYQDEYFLHTMPSKNPITMFGGNVKHKGGVKYTPQSLTGNGVSSFEGAKLISDSMIYTFYKIHADTANFELGRSALETLAFSSENVNATVDFKERKGEFISNTGASLTRFDEVQYQAYLDRFTWFMDQQELELSAKAGVVQQGANEIQVEGAEFVSIHPQQDSLRFHALTARYSLNEVKLQARKVKFVNVADAEIIPNNGIVTIHQYAQMDRLDSSMIIANKELRYHTIYDASTTIESRWKYKSSGKYDYVDENGLKQVVEFTKVAVDTTLQTYAEGMIIPEDDFSLSPMFRFKGAVELFANRKNLTFDGYSKLVHDCENIPTNWFSMEGEIDPKEILIHMDDDIHNADLRDLYTSLIMPRDSAKLYTALVGEKHHYRDLSVALASGYLQYSPEMSEYQVSNIQKLAENSLPGNFFAANIKTCEVRGSGQLDLTMNTERLKVKTVGEYTYNTINEKSDFNAVMLIDFLFDDGLLNMIIQDAKTAGLEVTDVDNPIYEQSLREWLGNKDADDLIGKMSLGKNVKIPEPYRKTFFINSVNLKWNEDTKSYISSGKIGIGNLGKESVNMLFDGGIELVQKRGNTDITIYLEISPSVWYIFSYRASTGMMKVYTSNKDFMIKLNEIKNDNKRIKAEKGIKQFIYIGGTKRLRSDFKMRLEEAEGL